MSAAFAARSPGRGHGRRILVIVVALLVYAVLQLWPEVSTRLSRSAAPGDGDTAVEEAFDAGASGRMLEVEGVVDRELADDREGSRHQRFIVRLASGRTLLVSHNIDLAPRVPLAAGDRLAVRGQYEWNERGGLLHWTHHDPKGNRPGGWIRHDDQLYR